MSDSIWKLMTSPGSAVRAVFLAFLVTLLACTRLPPIRPGGEALVVTGSLEVQSTPAGATISIDGLTTQFRTPTTITDLTQGVHTIRIHNDGYTPWKKTFHISEGESLFFDVRLLPVSTGVVKVSSVPFQCQIFVDGRQTHLLTPATLENLDVGTHTILLRREGYEDWSQAVVVVNSRQLQVKASLIPSAALAGHVQVQSHPPRAWIFLDGYPTGNRTPSTLYNIAAGSHRLKLTREGFSEWLGDITVHEGHTENLLITLKKPSAVLWGAARLETDPPGAIVILDGVQLRHKTPVELKDISRGIYPLELSRDNYRTWKGTLKIVPGEVAEISVTLRSRSEPQ